MVMRPHSIEDASDLYEYHSDPEVVRFVPWPVRTLPEVETWLEASSALFLLENEGDRITLSMVLKSENKVIGQVNAMYRSSTHQHAEIGYVINPKYAGQGLALEATAALIDSLFHSGKFRF
jgi:RimJ/RimL family protein N-acetyltransferase